ncbi:hypothetical protein LCGC14_1622020 [marine sediment metagenome]|uniref:Uncharacterized protein n=1 Tax=marine sediment metagenome TaxID=412755 RepID=A0A0F9KKS2_9ZZZZ
MKEGDRFGMLTVLGEAGRDRFRHILWRCRCDCGIELLAPGSRLKIGDRKTCGRHRIRQPRRYYPEKQRQYYYDPVQHERHVARYTTNHAVKARTLVKRPCVQCGSPDSQAHHLDYSQPLKVQWLCVPCHNLEHPKRKALILALEKAVGKET